MDFDGFYTQQIQLKDLIPVSYDDYLDKHKKEIPIMTSIDVELIYQDQNSQSFYLMDKFGHWNPSGANIKQLDIRNLFQEFEWIDKPHLFD